MTAELYPTFDDWWTAYDYKVGRKKASLLWSKLSHKDKCIAIEHTLEYVESTPEKQYRKHPTTYLNGEHYHDEIIAKGPAKAADAFQYFQQHYSGRN